MTLKVIGTGSAGNCYLLQQGEYSLLLEAGLRWKQILAGLPNGLRGIRACLITHEHMDHCMSFAQVRSHGVPVIMSAGTYNQLNGGIAPEYTRPIFAKAGQAFYIPPFTVMAVQAMHDAEEPLAYLIRHEETGETVLFATDTYLLPNKYPNINYWIVECNFITAKAEKLLEYPDKAVIYRRLTKSHMSLERLITTLQANDLSHTRTIVLIHISNERGDSTEMEDAVRSATGIRTIAAVNGMEIDLSTCPF